MSQRKGGRFSYLTTSGQQPEPPAEQRPGQTEQDGSRERKMPERNDETDLEIRKAGRSGGEGSKEKTSTARRSKPGTKKTPLANTRTVPKGQGRMKQDRSQLNIRIPTALKRQASAKAVLEGREIGEIVEELLREYISK